MFVDYIIQCKNYSDNKKKLLHRNCTATACINVVHQILCLTSAVGKLMYVVYLYKNATNSCPYHS